MVLAKMMVVLPGVRLFRDHQPQGQSWGPEVDPAVDCLEITNPKVNPEVLRSILRLIYTINNIVFIDIFQFFLNNWGDHTSIFVVVSWP